MRMQRSLFYSYQNISKTPILPCHSFCQNFSFSPLSLLDKVKYKIKHNQPFSLAFGLTYPTFSLLLQNRLSDRPSKFYHHLLYYLFLNFSTVPKQIHVFKTHPWILFCSEPSLDSLKQNDCPPFKSTIVCSVCLAHLGPYSMMPVLGVEG